MRASRYRWGFPLIRSLWALLARRPEIVRVPNYYLPTVHHRHHNGIAINLPLPTCDLPPLSALKTQVRTDIYVGSVTVGPDTSWRYLTRDVFWRGEHQSEMRVIA